MGLLVYFMYDPSCLHAATPTPIFVPFCTVIPVSLKYFHACWSTIFSACLLCIWGTVLHEQLHN